MDRRGFFKRAFAALCAGTAARATAAADPWIVSQQPACGEFALVYSMKWTLTDGAGKVIKSGTVRSWDVTPVFSEDGLCHLGDRYSIDFEAPRVVEIR